MTTVRGILMVAVAGFLAVASPTANAGNLPLPINHPDWIGDWYNLLADRLQFAMSVAEPSNGFLGSQRGLAWQLWSPSSAGAATLQAGGTAGGFSCAAQSTHVDASYDYPYLHEIIASTSQSCASGATQYRIIGGSSIIYGGDGIDSATTGAAIIEDVNGSQEAAGWFEVFSAGSTSISRAADGCRNRNNPLLSLGPPYSIATHPTVLTASQVTPAMLKVMGGVSTLPAGASVLVCTR